MSKKTRFYLILLYVVFLIIVVEGSVRLVFLSPQLTARLLEYHDEDYWWRRIWVNRHQNSGTEIYYKFDSYDSLKGWISKPNLRDMEVFGDKMLNTNSKGFRGKDEHAYDKDPNKLRILLLGDSFTFGDEVSDNETYAYYLQEMLPQVEVINMGVHGYGHDQMLLLLREEGVNYKPDIVILGFLAMDMSRNLLNFRDYAKPRFDLDNGELKLIGTPVPRPEDFLKWNWARPMISDVVSIARYRFMKSYGLLEKEKKKADITTAILAEIIKLTDSIHAIPIFVYLPPGGEISDHAALTQGEKFLFSMCRTNDKVRCFSARPHFAEKTAEGTIFSSKLHWGPEGHLATAEAIKHYLVDGGYVVLPQLHGSYNNAKPDKSPEPMRSFFHNRQKVTASPWKN